MPDIDTGNVSPWLEANTTPSVTWLPLLLEYHEQVEEKVTVLVEYGHW